MKVTSRPSGAIAPRWSQFRIRPVGSSRTVTGSDQVAPPSAERRWTTRWNHFDVSRNGLFDSMLRTRVPSARRRIALVSDGGPMSSGIGTIRHGVQVRPASSESARRTVIGRQPSVSGLKSGWPGNASRSIQSAATMRWSPSRTVIGAALSAPRRPSMVVSKGVTGSVQVRPPSVDRRSSMVRSSVSLPLPMLYVTSRLPSARTTNAGNVETARGVPGTAAERTPRSTISMTVASPVVRSGRVDRQVDRLAAVRRSQSRPRRPRPPPGRPRRGSPARPRRSRPGRPCANCWVCSAKAVSRIGL